MPLQFLTPHVAHLRGRLYSGNLSEVQHNIELALDRTQSLILDLDFVAMIDASGAYMLYIATKKARERNKEIILFCTDNELVKFIFSMLGLRYTNTLPDTNKPLRNPAENTPALSNQRESTCL